MKILFLGDLSFSYVRDSYPGEDAVKAQLKSLKPVLDQADIRIINLENILCDEECEPIIKSGPNLRSGTEFVSYLKEMNIGAACLANNHTGDYGEIGVKAVMKCLDDNNIAHFGAGANIEEAYKAFRFEIDGIKVSIIASCENEFGIAGEHTYGTAGYELGRVTKALRREKQVSDLVIFHFHGGNEENPFPSPRKVELYRHITDLGADAVIAMHTHCPQGYEYHNGKPIVYSMGNFFFPELERDQGSDSSWFFGYMSMLDITREAIKLDIHPYRFDEFEKGVGLLTGKEKESFIRYVEEISAPLSDMARIKDLFNIWSVIGGSSYSWTLEFKDSMREKGAAEQVKHLRNSLLCEAHNEMLSSFLELCYNECVDEFAARQDEIKKYQTIKLQI